MLNFPTDIYDHSARSAGLPRHQQLQPLQRQSSRQFDGYSNSLIPDDQNTRYEPGRYDRQNAASQSNAYFYEMGGAQSWNPNAFAGNNGFNSFGGTGRLRPSARGRTALPAVSITLYYKDTKA